MKHKRAAWEEVFQWAQTWGGPAPEPNKTFKPKHHLPVLADYTKPAPTEFWEKVPVNTKRALKPLIDPYKLEGLAMVLGTSNRDRLTTVLTDLKKGAEIGCQGLARTPTVSTNAPSAFEFPQEVTDAVAGWVHNKYALGPVPRHLVPANAKINGIMCRQKPNGSARVILNLSAPEPLSVNDGIDAANFPATMSSTAKWLSVLHRTGKKCWILKIDWQDAYKHLRVRDTDVDLQWFSWLGMYFAELCLVFGAASSAGIYDRAAKVVLDLAVRRALFPARNVCQYLDDTCAAAPAGDLAALRRLETAYADVAAQIGVKLASTDDPDKAFSPCTRGVVLGIEYDTVDWSWRIPPGKLARILAQIETVLATSMIKQDVIWSLTGRILHYAPLTQVGRFNLDHLLRASGNRAATPVLVPVSFKLKRQLRFWQLLLKATHAGAGIPAPPRLLPPWALDAFTDAAGGAMDGSGRGAGGVIGDWWFHVIWPATINRGDMASDGKRLSCKMSALELVGPLVCVAAAPELCRGTPMRIWVDNAGSVRIWQKGYSTRCPLCNTLVKAIATVAAALGCKVDIQKIRRCSSPGAILADALSKGALGAVRRFGQEFGWPLSATPAAVPRSILRWLAHPVPDDELGQKVLFDISRFVPVLGFPRP